MPLVRIHNEDWGFESNCFVCEPRNDQGLRIPFFHDTDAEMVVATFTLSNAFSGAPSFVHGGVTLAVLDEAMAWACIAVAHRWAVTTETATTFRKPIRVDVEHRVEARIVEVTGERIDCAAEVLDHRGSVRAEGRATFAALGEAQAVRAIGGELGADRSYLRRDG